MIQPPLPENEEARLAELLSYGVLDTQSEDLLDDITSLASEICETPIALISLVDPDRQWFKSKVGLDVDETHRNISFCGHAILKDELMEVNDTLLDKRFHDNPLVTGEPNIRFYAGTPLVTPTGYPLGTLCAIDREPRTLTDLQRNALATLGRSVIAHLELRKQNHVLKQVNTLKARYLSDISHRFKTPLKSICTFSNLLQEESRASALPPLFRHSLGLIEQSGLGLMRAVNSILATEAVAGGVEHAATDYTPTRPFFHHIFHSLEGLAKQKNMTFRGKLDGNVPESLLLDETQLGKVIMKVTGNALQYSQKNMPIEMSVHYYHNELIITVRDNGHGMSDEQLLAFVSNRQNGALPKLVESMRGKLKVKSAPGAGTLVTFSVTVEPVHTKPAPGNNEELDAASSDPIQKIMPLLMKSPRILFVEQDEAHQQEMVTTLADVRLQADLADNEQQAMALIDAQPYDLVIMSASTCSHATLEKVRKHHPCTPLVAVSDELFVDETNRIPADYVTARPLNGDTLSPILSFYLIADGKFTQ
ncbi:GAF domain-containing protein [Alteromonas confluentis]|uniref:histidine kinase n=1 Tax=Alteromonas confluentis TaxID=1656094 RepID=A0A1E7ZD00_9ALTE|nr:GAF domain-containing protein [Alteromonas confluentis]OFC71370.1 hypothetical protein BFC18_09465 [Alteromonas confluentis]